jgi:hypothetical protein
LAAFDTAACQAVLAPDQALVADRQALVAALVELALVSAGYYYYPYSSSLTSF